MDDWEDEHVLDIHKNVKPNSNWDDEDLEDDGVKDSWEDEDEEAPKSELAPKMTTQKSGTKKVKTVEALKETPPLDPIVEKLRKQRLVEEADYKSTTELFGKPSGEKTLDNFIPKSETDFLEYAELLAHKLRPYEKSYHYIGLLKAVMRLSVASLKGSDAKEVASSVTAISNEKIKVEKETTGGKKKGAKKKKLQVEKKDDDLIVDDRYYGYDDDDFM